MLTIRPEQAKDNERVRQINEQAFETGAEARLIDLLRGRGKLIASMVAEAWDDLLGHIAFSRLSVASCPERGAWGLGLWRSCPGCRDGASALHSFERVWNGAGTRATDMPWFWGIPQYYPRFGFIPAHRFGISCSWSVPKKVFMALELRAEALAAHGGLV